MIKAAIVLPKQHLVARDSILDFHRIATPAGERHVHERRFYDLALQSECEAFAKAFEHISNDVRMSDQPRVFPLFLTFPDVPVLDRTAPTTVEQALATLATLARDRADLGEQLVALAGKALDDAQAVAVQAMLDAQAAIPELINPPEPELTADEVKALDPLGDETPVPPVVVLITPPEVITETTAPVVEPVNVVTDTPTAASVTLASPSVTLDPVETAIDGTTGTLPDEDPAPAPAPKPAAKPAAKKTAHKAAKKAAKPAPAPTPPTPPAE